MNGEKYRGRTITVEFSVPKGSYEKRIDAIVEHTKMERNEAIKPQSVRIEAKEKKKQDSEPVPEPEPQPEETKTKTQLRKEKREQKQKESEEKAKKAAEEEESKATAHVKKPKEDASEATLFVRNVGWDTDEQEFRDFMETFGPLKYAVLCKARGDLTSAADGADVPESKNHKGTGFV